MEMALTFNDTTFSPVNHQNNLWIRAVELAKALGFKREDQAAKIYRAHADEFTPDMAQVVEILDNAESAFPVKSLIFSLRGCHLLAMFARTPVAKAFRKWVLDVLDRLNAERSAPTPDASRPSRRSDPERKALTAIINTWVGMAPIHYANARAQVNAHFGVTGVDAMTVAQVKEAIQWVQGKIDALPRVLPEAATHEERLWKLTQDQLDGLDRAAERFVALKEHLDRELLEIAGDIIHSGGFMQLPYHAVISMPALLQNLLAGGLQRTPDSLREHGYNPASIIRALAGYAPENPKAYSAGRM